jgi:hypothetical protein
MRGRGVGPTQATPLGERATMNLITDILAGLVHFVGWLA